MSVQSPDNPNAGPIEDKALDTQDVIDILAEDDKDGEVPEETIELGKAKKGDTETGKKEASEAEKEEKDLEDELEEELKQPDEEDLELVDVPRRKEILAAFPDLFKKFPQIEKAMYRERAYSDILPTIEDARIAVEKAETLDEHDQQLQTGTVEGILGVVHEGNKETFAKLVDNYLPALFKVDQQAYYHTIGNVIKHTIISMVNDGKSRDDDNLSNAAAVLNEYMFGTTRFTHPQKLSKDEVSDPESKQKEEEISEREQALLERQFEEALGGLENRVDRVIESTISKHIDPRDSMSAYTKNKAIKQVENELEAAIGNDTRFKKIYDTMWLKAKDSDFDKESMDKIYRAYVSKAGTLLSGIISKVRKEAMGDIKLGDRKERDRRGPLPVGKNRVSTPTASGSAARGNTSRPQIPKGMTTLEFLNSDD